MPTNIAIPSIKFGKRKQRSQMCEVFTEDGRIVDVELDVLRGCINDPITEQAFIIDSDNQYTNESGYWTQVLGERSTIPICMVKPHKMQDGKNDDEELKGLINQIFHESQEAAKLAQYLKAGKREMWNKLLWIITVPCVTVLLIFAIQYFGGKR